MDDKVTAQRKDIGRLVAALLKLKGKATPQSIADKFVSPAGLLRVAKGAPEVFDVEGLPSLLFVRGDRVFVGGGGVVFQVRNARIPSIKYALKVQRPSLLDVDAATALENYDEAQQEYLKHAPLSHENIARVFGAGTLPEVHRDTGPPSPAHPVLMEWVESALPLLDHLASRTSSIASAVTVLAQCFTGLDYLHAAGLIHWDMKGDNLLVSGTGVPKVMDIGNARRVDDMSRPLKAYSTDGNYPDVLMRGAAVGLPGTTRRSPIDLPDYSWDAPWLDMWMLARELNRLFEADAVRYAHDALHRDFDQARHTSRQRELAGNAAESEDAEFQLAGIKLILQRLLAPSTPGAPRYYEAARDVASDFEKLIPEFGGAQGVSELHAVPQHVLRIPVSGNVPFSRRLGALYNLPLVQRLALHKQLGTIAHVYPGASHKRVEHVAGVVAATISYVRALYADRSAPFWRITIERIDVEALLVAALLHDVGHVAFGHFLEEMAGVMRRREHEDYVIALLDPARGEQVWANWDQNPPTRDALHEDRESLFHLIERDWGSEIHHAIEFGQRVAAILRPLAEISPVTDEHAILDRAMSERLKLEVLHSIIESAIDADKLDYLLRDAHHTGVRYPTGIDPDRFFQALTAITFIGRERAWPDTQATIGVTAKGQLPVESILIGRYQMFACVYWHHTTRAETVMLQFAVSEYLRVGGKAVEIAGRLEDLLTEWRRRGDGEALGWLANKLWEDRRRLGKSRWGVVNGILQGLQGDRNRLYWRAFELRYEGQATGGETYAQKIAQKWLTVAQTLGMAATPRAYIEEANVLRNAVRGRINLRVGHPVIEEGELLLDVPPAGKDQIANVFVVRDGRPIPIQECTPLAMAVHDSFELWVRNVRIFLAPTAWKRIQNRGISDKQMWSHCWEVMKGMADPTLDLFAD